MCSKDIYTTNLLPESHHPQPHRLASMRNGPRHRRNRSAGPISSKTAVLVIDCSGSTAEPMEGRSKIAVVEETILHLIHHKQRLFS